MRKILSLFFALMMAFSVSAKVAFLVPADNTSRDALRFEEVDGLEQSPERRAYDWFNTNFVSPGNGQFICLSDLSNLSADINTIWIYVDRVGFNAGDFDNLFNASVKANLQAFLNAGGNLFLCKQATRLEKDLVGATDGQSDEAGSGKVIVPDYNDGGYVNPATWAVDYKFYNEWASNGGHRMFASAPHRNDNEAELIWTNGRKLTNNNCGIGTGAMGMNDIWDGNDHLVKFQTRNNCKVLGTWANGDGCHYGGVIEFYPTGTRKGTVIMFGLAAYQWINNNAGNGWENTQEITKGALEYLNARPCALDNTTPMEEKLADDYFYPSNTTTFRTLHSLCEDMAAAYSIASDPNGIARIYDGKLQFKAAGTVTLHITLTENREFKNWPKGAYEYDREITFAYANPNAAQDAVNEDFPGNGVTSEGEPAVQMAMRLHPSVRGMDSVSYTITNHCEATEGEAYKKTEDGVTRLYFRKSGKVLLTINLNETDWVEAWPMGAKQFTRVVEFNYTQEAGPTFTWPSEFETGAVGPNSVITLPETVGGLTVTYTVEGNASLSGNVLTLANVESGSVTVHASVTETGFRVEWPVGTYNYDNSLSFHAAEVGYLLPAAESIDHMAGWYEGEQPEYNAATWFQETYIATGKGRFVTVNELPTLLSKGITTLWVNIERIGITTEEGMFSDMPVGLKTYIQAGGNVLLTKQATRLAYLMDRISYAPEFNAGGYSTENTNNLRSIATCMGTGEGVNEPLDMSGHRLYSGMLSYWEGKNVFLVAPDCKKTMNYCSWQDFMRSSDQDTHYDNCLIQRVRDFEQDWHATVFGIQGSIGDYCFSDVVEFNATGEWQGRILTIGSAAYQWGTSNNHVELENMKTLTSNALSYLLDKPVDDEVYTRDIMNNMYGTICWGYAVEEGHIEGAEMYELTSFNATGDAIILTEVTSMMAGRAYFFFGTSDQLRLTYHGQKKEAEEGGHNGLVGYIPLMGSEPYRVPANDNKYILYYDELLLVDSEIDLPAHRAYVNYEDIPAYNAVAPAGARRRVMSINRYQAPTGLETVEHSAQSGSYDILGRKVNNPQSAGFYIINGKKVIITQ